MSDYDLDLIIKVAELYYIHDLTQQKIANRLKISRVKVSRVLTEAKKRGVVEIRINYPSDNCIKLETKFEQLFNLKEALIISSKDKTKEILFSEVTKNAAHYLLQKLQDKDVLGVAWGRTLRQVANSISLSKKEVEIIQMIGNIGSGDMSADEIVRKLSIAFGSKYNILPAPAIVDSEEIRDAIISDGAITQVLEKTKQITVAMVGIGDLSRESAFVVSGYLKEDDINILKKSGTVGDICGSFFDEKGNLCDTCFNRRVIGISFDQLKKIPYVIAVASGSQKAQSILGALKSGVLNVLITDEITALEVLSLYREP